MTLGLLSHHRGPGTTMAAQTGATCPALAMHSVLIPEPGKTAAGNFLPVSWANLRSGRSRVVGGDCE